MWEIVAFSNWADHILGLDIAPPQFATNLNCFILHCFSNATNPRKYTV